MSNVIATERTGKVLTVTIQRPEALNALNSEVLTGLTTVFEDTISAQDLAAVLITGAGEKAFVAGADIREMVQSGVNGIGSYVERGQKVMRLIEQYPVPVVAAVNGFALGGGMELALACDIIVASSTAKFGQPEVNLGVIPGFGGTQRLLERCSIGAARKLIYSGEIIPAQRARELGIVDEIYEPAELLVAARKLVDMIASKGPLAVRMAKRVIRGAQDQILTSGLRREVEGFVELFGTADREEGMKAFVEKRAPVFKGK